MYDPRLEEFMNHMAWIFAGLLRLRILEFEHTHVSRRAEVVVSVMFDSTDYP